MEWLTNMDAVCVPLMRCLEIIRFNHSLILEPTGVYQFGYQSRTERHTVYERPRGVLLIIVGSNMTDLVSLEENSEKTAQDKSGFVFCSQDK